MIRWLCALVWLLCPALALAQDGPTLSVSVEETETIPGQPLTVRITVLVPTYMPQPPVWPAYEAPNLLVRLPEKSTSPTSQTVNGATWAGITRRYQISPMIPGRFDLPASEVVVTWADPESNQPRKTTLRTEPVTLTGIVPDGADGLDPFIAAAGLELSQEITGTPDALVPGDSVSRSVTARITGTSPMFLPPLVAGAQVPGLRAYPDEPVLEIRDDRGILSGTRVERVSYLAQSAGAGQVPGITLDWYNIETGRIETATLPGIDILIDGPVGTAGPAGDRAARIRRGAAVAVGAVLALLLGLRLWPVLRRWRAARRAAWLRSEAYGWRQVRRAVAARDLGALEAALDLWQARLPGGCNPRRMPEVSAALLQIGAARYGRGRGDASAGWSAGWAALRRALPALRRSAGARHPAARPGLPPLNQ